MKIKLKVLKRKNGLSLFHQDRIMCPLQKHQPQWIRLMRLSLISVFFIASCKSKKIDNQPQLISTIRPMMQIMSYEEDHEPHKYKRYEINTLYSSPSGLKLFSVVNSSYYEDNFDTSFVLNEKQIIAIRLIANQIIEQKVTPVYNSAVAGETTTIEMDLFFPRQNFKMKIFGRSFNLLMEIGVIRGRNLGDD